MPTTTFTLEPNGDFRNEGWAFVGGSTLNGSWSDSSDTTYVTNPGNKGRAAVTFPQDLTSGNIPFGSKIESITLNVRAANTDSSSRLTVNMISSEDTGYFTGRSIPLTTTPTTYTVSTHTCDPLRRDWDRDRINRLIVQVFSYSTTAATVKVYEVFVTVNYRMQPTVLITSPSGTVASSSPLVAWTYTQNDGDPQKFAEYKIFTADQVAKPTFNSDFTPSSFPAATKHTVVSGDSLFKIAAETLGDGDLWPTLYAASTLRSGDPNLIFPGEIVTIPGIGTVQGDVSSFTLPFALTANSYYIYVRVISTHGVISPWASKPFTVGVGGSGNPGAPGGSLGGIGTGGGGGFESVIADATTSNIFVNLRDGSNLLGVQQADFETLTDSNDWTGTNCTPTQDLTIAYSNGGASIKMAAASAATMSMTTDWTEVTQLAPLTLRAQGISAVTGRVVNISLHFADDSFNVVGSTSTQAGADVTNTWTEIVLTNVTSPVGATQVQAVIQVVSPANGEVHHFDHIGLMYGTNSAWSNGGHASRNLLTSSQCNADDPVAVEPFTADTGSTYSRVAPSGTGADGGKSFKILYAGGGTGTIAFVATGAAFTDTTSSATYTLNKPVGVANGNLLVAYVAAESTGVTGVCTQALAPSGWTLIDSTSNGNVSLSILMRDGLAADPTTWTGQLTQGATQVRKRAVVVAYSGAASTATQLQAFGVSNSVSGSQVPQTPSVFNSASGAWRLSAFAVNDDATGGSMTANIAPSGAAAPIAFVGVATAGGGRDTSSLNYVINRPANLVTGDLMVAGIQMTENVTINAPTGWIKVRGMNGLGASAAVMVRTATASEPSSWTGTTSSSSGAPWVTQTSAYRNCDIASNQFLAENGAVAGTATFSTPTVSNTNSSAWRICFFGIDSNGGSSTTSNEVVERSDGTNGGFTPSATVAMYDSNGPVSTGSHQRTAVASNDLEVNEATAWMGFIKPATSGGTPGVNETKRQDATAGAANPWLTLAVFDSAAVAATGSTTVYGTFTPGSGSNTVGTASFIGFLVPSSGTVSGEAGCTLSSYVDISSIGMNVRSLAGNQVTMAMNALGSVSGTPHLKLYAYAGNELISAQVAEGTAFSTSVWSKSTAKFVLPTGTTRFKVGMSMIDCAINDFMLFDRVALNLGSSTSYRQGTGSAAHPIYSVPLVEYQEDLGLGYGDWIPLPGVAISPLTYDGLTGLCTFIDQMATPLSARRYRARTQSFGLAGDIFTSSYGPVSDEITLVADDFWLKDVVDNNLSMKLKVFQNGNAGPSGGLGTLAVTTTDSSAAFQPLGASLPLVVTEGYKGDTIDLTVIVQGTELQQLKLLLNSGHTLFLQSNSDACWWVRPVGSYNTVLQPTGQMQSNPLRFVSLSFLQVAPEA